VTAVVGDERGRAVGAATRRRYRGLGSLGAAGIAAVVFLVLLLLVATIGSRLYTRDPNAQDLLNTLSGPGGTHPLGTDALGRDVAARMIAGAQITFLAMAIAVLVALTVGLVPALIAGYFGGRTDRIIMRCVDVVISFPALVLAIALIGVLGPGLLNAMVVVGLIQAPNLTRVVRSSVVDIRNGEYMEAARLLGASHWRMVSHHVLRNVMPTIIVMVNLIAAYALLAEAGLSFIGLGVTPPQASWGSMLKEAVPSLGTSPYLAIIPGVAVTLTVLALNIVADSLRRLGRSR
jgi:ABC-type dipeptide/oligopeptide/nickel transport system permease subunit